MQRLTFLRLSFFATLIFSVAQVVNANAHTFDIIDPKPGVGDFTISIPETLNAYLEKETVDNSVRYKFKKSDGTSQFLFSISRVSEQQWLVVKDQVSNVTLHSHKNGFIYFVERTDKTSMKGADKEAYANTLSQLDAIIRSIDIRG